MGVLHGVLHGASVQQRHAESVLAYVESSLLRQSSKTPSASLSISPGLVGYAHQWHLRD